MRKLRTPDAPAALRLLFPLLALFWCARAGADPAPAWLGPPTVVEQAPPPTPLQGSPVSQIAGPLDLLTLWDLAVANNPLLREAQAEVEAARGQWIQAGKYPNPRFSYSQQELGTPQAPAGTIVAQVNQEFLTAGKRGLDLAIAARGTDVAALALVGRRFDLLTRLRRAYYDYAGWQYTVRVNEETLAALRQGVEITRKLVEEVKSRPRTDLLRLQTLLEEAKNNLVRSQVNLTVAWRQLAAEVGVPELPRETAAALPPVPAWNSEAVVPRVLAVHTDLRQAAVEAQRARLEVDRARAEAVPNVTVGTGYSLNFPEREQGAAINLEMALPVWDRKQGRIHEALARLSRAQAAQRSTLLRLTQATDEALGRYETARRQLERLANEILPRQVETLRLVRQGYQVSAAGLTFADVLLAEQAVHETRIRQADLSRELWRAVADLQGLMQLDLADDLCPPP
jgi:cobalt-zinc-cadmium efflux system outer membrane protein